MDSTMEVHMWLENADGTIAFDPDFPDYNWVKQVRRLTGDKCHKAYTGRKAIDCLAEIRKALNFRIKMLEQNGLDKEKVWDIYFKSPAFGICFFNAMAYWKKNKHLKIKVGSMGWESKLDGNIFWEYGDGRE